MCERRRSGVGLDDAGIVARAQTEAGGGPHSLRRLQVQFRGIKNNDPTQFKGIETQAVVDPPTYASAEVIYPYEKARA